MSQTNAGAQWSEVEQRQAQSLTRVFLTKDGGGDWIFTNDATLEKGQFIDWQGNDEYELLDISTPAVLAASGADYQVQTSGTEVAHLIEDGQTPDLLVNPIESGTKGGAIYPDGVGDLIVVPKTAKRLGLAMIGSDIIQAFGT